MKSAGGHLIYTKKEVGQRIPIEFSRLLECPLDPVALMNLCSNYNVLEQDDEAFRYAERAVHSLPWMNAKTYLNYACILRQYGRHEEAFPYIQRAHQILPNDQMMGHIYAEELIRKGRWLEAWPLCSRYRESKQWIAPKGVQEWKGEDLNGKRIMVITEGGRGDAFWLFRFYLKLHEMGAIVSYCTFPDVGEYLKDHPWCHMDEEEKNPRLKDDVVFYDKEHPYDYWVSIFELLQWLKVDKPWFPGTYLEGDPKRVPLPRNGKPLVGICWECGEAMDVRKFRSLKLDQAAQLISNRNVEWISLQKGYKAPEGCREPEIRSWNDTASIISNLDLVITVDTSIVHLAGAMGKDTWLILGGYQDCKWGREDTSGWYPSVKIFRNSTVGFDGTVTQIQKSLDSYRHSVANS
jgi:tetratricopeptide (TPR) repeat protein